MPIRWPACAATPLALCFQRYNLIATASATDNVALPAIYAGLPLAARQARARRYWPSWAWPNAPAIGRDSCPAASSSGVDCPRADERRAPWCWPTSLPARWTPAAARRCWRCSSSCTARGRTIILITHDLDIARHAERIVRLRDGRVESDSGPVARAPAPLPARPPGQPSLRAELGESLSMAFTALRANVFRTVLTLLG